MTCKGSADPHPNTHPHATPPIAKPLAQTHCHCAAHSGMRAVNTVIQAAGNNRQANPNMEEDLLVLSALADSNRPKFLAEDMVLFNSIMSDLFPGKEVPKPDYSDLIERTSFHCQENNKIPTETFLFKCIRMLRHALEHA